MTVPRIVLVRHGDGPEDDRVALYFRARGVTCEVVRPFRGEALGPVDGAVLGTVVYGGPFAVFEEARFPFLRDEARWIEAALGRGVPLLGICQGAQQLARVLGAEVGPLPGEPHEFGVYEVTPTAAGRAILPGPTWLTQSHFHSFALPKGAELLATGATFPQQAFRYGPAAYGFQFHAEVTRAGFRRWQAADWAWYGKPGAQDRAEQDRLLDLHDGAQADWFAGFLDHLFGAVAIPTELPAAS